MNNIKDLLFIIFGFTAILVLPSQGNFFVLFYFISCIFLYGLKKYIDIRRELINEREYFIQTLSHDLRVSTIAQIRGLEILQKEYNSEVLAEIHNSCAYTLDMITMLVNSYQFKNGEKFLHKEIFNLNESVQLLKKDLDSALKSKELKLIFDIKNQIYADKSALTKVLKFILACVIDNSFRNKEIILKTQEKNNNIYLSVQYEGKYLTYEERERMFERNTKFSTVGQGIKMNFCKKIIEFHNGKLFVSSKKQCGNQFKLIIPKNNKKDLKYSSTKDFVINLNNYPV